MKNNRLFSIVFISLLIVTVSFGQSGRRAQPTPTPVAAKQDDAGQYSESKPRPSRVDRISNRFPGIGDGGNVKADEPKILAPVNGTASNDDGDVLKVETNLITIPVSVFDRNGLYIPGMRQNEFKIFEDGKEQEIAYFGASDKPFTVALLIDTSPSTAYKIEEIRRAATAFVDHLQPQDSVVVVEFNHSVIVRSEATTDREKIYKAISKANFGDGTSLYNAVDEGIRRQLGVIKGRKAVVLFTDGVDTTSRKNSYESTLNYAEESDSLIFPIYYNTFFDNAGGGGISIINGGVIPQVNRGSVGAGNSAGEYALGKKYLEELADATGGRVFRPESTPGGLTAAFEGIAEELRRQYNIGYVPSDEGKVGQRKQIRVRVDRPNLVVRSRDSYIVGAAAAADAAPTLVKPNN